MHLTIDVRKAFDTGIGTYIRQLVPRVVRQLPSAHVDAVILRSQAARHDYLADCGVNLIEIDDPPFSLREQWTLKRLVRSDRLFWATSLAHPLLTSGPVVNTVHDLAQLALPRTQGGSVTTRLLAKPFFERIRRLSRQILFASDFTASEFARLVGEPCVPAVVAELGVDPLWFDPGMGAGPRPVDGPYFTMLGSLRPHKNLRAVLESLAMLGEALPHRLLVIGSTGSEAEANTARDLLASVAPRVVFAGHLPRQAVAAALRHAEALLFPSHYEGFGLPVLEAMACGCPVVVARNGISAQLAGDLALTFGPDDIGELAAAMLTQVRMPVDQRRRQVSTGIERARSFTWDRTASVTAAALEQAARGLPGRTPV